jgi:hypothetical protein
MEALISLFTKYMHVHEWYALDSTKVKGVLPLMALIVEVLIKDAETTKRKYLC